MKFYVWSESYKKKYKKFFIFLCFTFCWGFQIDKSKKKKKKKEKKEKEKKKKKKKKKKEKKEKEKKKKCQFNADFSLEIIQSSKFISNGFNISISWENGGALQVL